jgi:hypothetical protein
VLDADHRPSLGLGLLQGPLGAGDVTALRDGIFTPDWYVLDSKGRKYDQSYMEPDGTRYLQGTGLERGQSVAGVVTFDLPVKHGQLVVPHSDGEPQLVWEF